jgi:hypothetical protein
VTLASMRAGVLCQVCSVPHQPLRRCGRQVLRAHCNTIVSVLETFVHDPVIDWTRRERSDEENPHARDALSTIEGANRRPRPCLNLTEGCRMFRPAEAPSLTQNIPGCGPKSVLNPLNSHVWDALSTIGSVRRVLTVVSSLTARRPTADALIHRTSFRYASIYCFRNYVSLALLSFSHSIMLSWSCLRPGPDAVASESGRGPRQAA